MPESTLTVNRWTPTRKAAIVLELLRGADVGELARTHGLSQAQLFAGRDLVDGFVERPTTQDIVL